MKKKITSFFVSILCLVAIFGLFLYPNVILASFDVNFKKTTVPTDKYYENQWYLKKINAPRAWNIINETPEVVIAIIDSGVQIDHPDLKDNIWVNKGEIPGNGIDDDGNGYIDDINGWDFVNNVSSPEPKFKDGYTSDGILHGTIVAGVVAASGNNNKGISGVTWKAQIMPLKVLDDAGEGEISKVIKAVNYAVDNGADIINFSFVGRVNSIFLRDAIQNAYDEGLIIVAAAGNDQESENGEGVFLNETPLYPACYEGRNGENIVIGVAATDGLDQKEKFSSYGSKCVDIVAPGDSVFSTVYYEPNIYLNQKSFSQEYDGYWSGTSIATPMVAGAIALVGTVNPSLKRDEIINIIKTNSDDISRLNPDYVGQLGSGRLNLYKSVMAAKSLLSINKVDLLVSCASNGTSTVSILNRDGELKEDFFAYNENFRGGVNVASGDINGDGIDEIITGAGNGGGPQVRIFKPTGEVIGQFFAYNENFRGGVNVKTLSAKTNIREKNKKMIIVSPGPGLEPKVKIYNNKAELVEEFDAYNKNFLGGVYLASGDINGDGIDEVITGAGSGASPHVRIFEENGRLIESFFALDKNFSGGITVGTIKY